MVINPRSKSNSMECVALDLFIRIYYDLCDKCGCTPESRDIETSSRRYRHEGFQYFSETLPRLGRDLEHALENGFIDTADFSYFKKYKSAKYPCFLKVFFCQIFDDTGQLLGDADPIFVGAVRQLSYFFKKIKEVCNDERIEKALQSYRVVEQELQEHTFPEEWRRIFIDVSSSLWSSLDEFNSFEAIPKHGPGAVFERAREVDKYPVMRSHWSQRLDTYFPYDAYCLPNTGFYSCKQVREILDGTSQYAPDDTSVFVIAVPKTALKPRLIGVEKTANMYCQQSIKTWLYDTLEKRESPYKGHINFTDQSINGRLALASSATRKHSTLDMSDASNRVPLEHVELMLSSAKNLLNPMLACRADWGLVPTDVKQIYKGPTKCPVSAIKLRKFASMGSACCFPIEAMYFYTICVCALLGKDCNPTYASLKDACSKIWVYGDDIIVPVEYTQAVISALVAFGNKVNEDKSFWKGFFRESCGIDAYKGVEITPVYMRKHLPVHSNSPDWLSVIATSNQLYEHGLWRASDLLKTRAEAVVGCLPIAERESVGLHLWSYLGVPDDLGLPRTRRRYSPEIQTHQIKVWQWYRRKKKSTKAKGVDLLLSYFVDKETANIQDLWKGLNVARGKEIGEIVDRSEAGTLKLRWYPPVPKVAKPT